MALIIEGFDGCGKSTLAQKFGLEVKHPGPRPKTWGDEQRCLEAQLRDARLPIVMDRITCISSQVYKGLLFDKKYMSYLDRMVYTTNCVIIHCRPPTDVVLDMLNHEAKSYDTKAHIDDITKNAKTYLQAYDNLLKSTPHLLYNYTKPDNSVIDTALDLVFNVGAWKSWMK